MLSASVLCILSGANSESISVPVVSKCQRTLVWHCEFTGKKWIEKSIFRVGINKDFEWNFGIILECVSCYKSTKKAY